MLSLTVMFLFSASADSSTLKDGKVFSQNREKSNMIALTFDDGPHPRYTPQILEILKEYQITRYHPVQRYPNVLKLEHSESG